MTFDRKGQILEEVGSTEEMVGSAREEMANVFDELERVLLGKWKAQEGKKFAMIEVE